MIPQFIIVALSALHIGLVTAKEDDNPSITFIAGCVLHTVFHLILWWGGWYN